MITIDYETLQNLKQRCLEASPCTWENNGKNVFINFPGFQHNICTVSEGAFQKHNAEFIAAANPEMVLHLINIIEQLNERMIQIANTLPKLNTAINDHFQGLTEKLDELYDKY